MVICAPDEVDFLSAMLDGAASVSPVTSEDEFEALTSKDLALLDGVLVRAELSWQGRDPDEHYGFDVAVSLRLRLKLPAPVCMLSFRPKKYFSSLPFVTL